MCQRNSTDVTSGWFIVPCVRWTMQGCDEQEKTRSITKRSKRVRRLCFWPWVSQVRVLFEAPKKREAWKSFSFFIQSEGLVCNRRQAYVIRLRCKWYGIKPQGLYFSSFGLITYIFLRKWLHPHLTVWLHSVWDGLHTRLRLDCVPYGTMKLPFGQT